MPDRNERIGRRRVASRRADRLLLLALLACVPHAAAAPRLSFYETRSILLSAEQVAALAGDSYWQARLRQETQLTLVTSTEAMPEGLDALYAALYAWLPEAPAGASDWVFNLTEAGSLGARATLRPAQQRPELEVQPLQVDAVSTVEVNSVSTRAWRPRHAFRHAGFPGGVEAYCAARPDVCAAVFAAGDEQRRTLLTVTASGGRATFLVDRTSVEAAQSGPTVRYLGDVGVTPLSAPGDFADRDVLDLALDGPTTVRGTDTFTRRERIAVKAAIAGYVQSGTRSAEADVVLPAGARSEDMLYTLRLLPEGNEVTVESLGPAADLLPAAGPRSDVRRIRGYPAKAQPGKLVEWLRKRYPALTATGRTADEIAASADRAIEQQSTKPGWFAANYQITVLDAKAADRRLAEVHGRPTQQRGGLRAFTAAELRALEAVLQRLDAPGLAALRGTALVRQRAAEEASPFGDLSSRVQITGYTFTRTAPLREGEQRARVTATVVIYDSAHSPQRFVGGRAPDGILRVYPPVAEVIAHELAHVISARAPVQQQFDALVNAVGASPFTRYAASNPQTEFLPEAFALYLLDPAWVNDNHPELYARIQAYLRRPRPGAL